MIATYQRISRADGDLGKDGKDKSNSMGIGCEPIRLDSYTQKKMTFFFDPDGLPLELHE